MSGALDRLSNAIEMVLRVAGIFIGIGPAAVAVVLGSAWATIVIGWRAGRS